MKTVWLLLFCLSLSASEFPFPADSENISVASNPLGGRMAVWEERGRILASEMPSNGSWSMPVVLSSAMTNASSPHVKIDASGKTVVTWVENDTPKTASKLLGGGWILSQVEGREKSETSRLALQRFNEDGVSLQLKETRPMIAPVNKKHIPIAKKNIEVLANAIDAPTSSVLSGGQIGFAAGTAAPSNGLVVSGISGFGFSAVVNDVVLPVQINAAAATERYFGADKGGTYGLLVGYTNAGFLALTGGIIRNVAADPLYVYVNSTTQAAQFSILGELGLGATPTARLHIRSPSVSTSNQFVLYNTGEIISTVTSSTAGEAIDVFLSPTNTVGIGASIILFPKFAPSGAVTLAAGLYIDPLTGSGTITNSYAIYAAKPSAGTNRYCAYFEGPVGIGTAAPVNQLDVTTGAAIGSYAGVSTAPSNGLIVSGRVGIGTASPGGACLAVQGTASLTNLGIHAGTTLDNLGGFALISAEIYVDPLYTGAGVATMAGCYVTAGTSTTTPTTGYGIYVNQPAYGNEAYAAYIGGGMVHAYVHVGDHTVVTSNYYVGVISATSAKTITLPATVPVAGWTCIINDETGNAATNTITVDGNGNNIDGAATYPINTDYGSVSIYSDGTQYYTF